MFVSKLIICILLLSLSITGVECFEYNNTTIEHRKVPDESLQTGYVPLMFLLFVFILIGGLLNAQK